MTRILLSIALLLLIGISGWFGYRTALAEWGSNLHDVDSYARAPGCFKGNSDVDPNLPSCTTVPMIVVGKTTHSERDRVNVSGVKTAYDLTIQDSAGRIFQYEDVSDYFWDDVRVGETISAKFWQGRVHELDAGEESYSVYSPSPQTESLLYKNIAWAAIFFISIGFLSALWQPRRRGLFSRGLLP